MRIACDARALLGPLTGVGTWTLEIMGGLAASPGLEVVLAAPRPVELPPSRRGHAMSTLPTPPFRLPGTLWLHTLLPAALAAARAEVFVASLAIAPRRSPVPVVTMVHDLTPRTHPHRHTLANRFCFNAYLEESLELSAAVVTGSSATAIELEATFPWLAGRLVRIGYGVDGFFTPAPEGDDGRSVREQHAGGRRYLLHLGTLEPRTGLEPLVAAWEALCESLADPPALVVAGAPGWRTGPILARLRRSPRAQHLHLPGYVSRAEVRDLMRHAEVFVLASEAEGYGLPLAEAICCGAPAVAADLPVLRETAGDAAVYADAADPAALAAAIARALDPAVAADLRRRTAARAAKLSWAPAVAAWAELLERVAREGGRGGRG